MPSLVMIGRRSITKLLMVEFCLCSIEMTGRLFSELDNLILSLTNHKKTVANYNIFVKSVSL